MIAREREVGSKRMEEKEDGEEREDGVGRVTLEASRTTIEERVERKRVDLGLELVVGRR